LVWQDFEPDHISYSHSHAGSLLQQQDQIWFKKHVLFAILGFLTYRWSESSDFIKKF